MSFYTKMRTEELHQQIVDHIADVTGQSIRWHPVAILPFDQVTVQFSNSQLSNYLRRSAVFCRVQNSLNSAWFALLPQNMTDEQVKRTTIRSNPPISGSIPSSMTPNCNKPSLVTIFATVA